MDIEINKLNENHVDLLHRHYDGQTEAQPCYLELELDLGNFSADYNAEIGNAVPMNVHHGRELRYPIPCLTAAAANELMERLAPLADRVYVGSDIEWDDNNHVGRLDEDAAAAHEELGAACAALFEPGAVDARDLIIESDAYDWFPEGPTYATAHLGITAETTDDQLYEIWNKTQSDALTDKSYDSPTVILRLEEYLKGLRDALKD